jgi:hypothetical protein
MKRSAFVSTVAVFAAFNVICDSLMGPPLPVESSVWYSWGFMATPITGIVLGPYAGFLSTLIGVMIGHFVYFRGPYEFLFTLGAPIGAMISGFLFRGRWKITSIYYTLLLAIYFVTPVAWQLPIWGMWNVYLAYAGLLVAIITVRKKSFKTESRGLLYAVAICAFIGLEADVLFRIFVFIPCQTYRLLYYDLNVEALRSIWVLGAVETSIKATMSTIVTAIIGPPLIKAIKKTGFSSWFK